MARLAADSSLRTDAVMRTEDLRRGHPDLPTVAELAARYGYAWLSFKKNANLIILTPWPCSCCGGHVARLGSAACVKCVAHDDDE